MIFNDKNNSLGFALVEVLLSISIFSVLIFVVAQLLVSTSKVPNEQMAIMNSIDKARLVSSAFNNEIRAAAYGSYPLFSAGNSEIIFHTTIGATGNAVNKVRYFLNGTSLFKGVTPPSGGTYNPNDEVVKEILTGIANEDVPLFYYYDGNYDGDDANHPPIEQPVNVNQVKFVKINLVILNKATTQDTTSFTINAGSAIRSLKENLAD